MDEKDVMEFQNPFTQETGDVNLKNENNKKWPFDASVWVLNHISNQTLCFES